MDLSAIGAVGGMVSNDVFALLSIPRCTRALDNPKSKRIEKKIRAIAEIGRHSAAKGC